MGRREVVDDGLSSSRNQTVATITLNSTTTTLRLPSPSRKLYKLLDVHVDDTRSVNGLLCAFDILCDNHVWDLTSEFVFFSAVNSKAL